jgi:outer membrane usher protein
VNARILRYLVVPALALRTLSAAAEPLTPVSWQAAPLEVIINSQEPGPLLVMLRETPHALWLEAADFHTLRLRVPKVTPVVQDGHAYYPLAAIPGLQLELDEPQQRVRVEVPASAFETSAALAAPNPAPPLSVAAPGASLSYQLSAQRTDGADAEGALGKLNFFGPWGVFSNSGVVRSVADDTQGVRLDTTYTLDFPSVLQTLTLGDAISTPGSWGDAVRYAGFHLGTNFGIRPDLITTPLLSVAGAAVVPSTVDVLINNQRVSSQPVPPGPFIINNVPPLTGEGQVSVVVRDALGREQVISQSFYSGATLLAAGLSQYALDFGALRENYALASDDYGPFVGEATYRRGITDAFTLEEHAEYQTGAARAGGLDAALRTGSLGILTLTGAAGGAPGTSGWLGGLGFEHHAEVLSLTASELFASEGFRQVGDDTFGERFRQQTLGQLGFNLGRAGSVSLAWVRQTFETQPAEKTATLSYYLAVGSTGSVTVSLSRSSGGNTTAATSAYLSFTRAIGPRDTATVGGVGGSGPGTPRDAAFASLTHSPPPGIGDGYRLSAASSGDYDADWREQFSEGDVELEAARNQGIDGERALAEGTLTFLGGALYAARTVPGSFAVVNVGQLPDVPVYVENQEVARTDAAGNALLPDLLPYAANRISINPVQLPLDTSIGLRQITVAPPYQSGVLVKFPVAQVRAGLFHLVTSDDGPVPAGATVQLHGAAFPVALDGLVYVTGFDRGMSGQARWPGHACRFQLAAPPRGDPLPDLGTVVCRAEPEPEAAP